MIDWSSEWQIRAVLVVLLIVTGGYLGISQETDATRNSAQTYFEQAELPEHERMQVVGERPNATVVTTRGMQQYLGTDALYVFSGDGKVEYLENRSQYADVDPSPEGTHTLQVAADTRRELTGCEKQCTDQMIRLINYSTGETTDKLVYNTPSDRDSNWHDVDRIGPDKYVVAGIWNDEVWIVNTSTKVVTWKWNMQFGYSRDGGGPYPQDWAHLNDVEYLADGRIMASPRNQDQVIFIHPEKGLQEDWTLGCDDCFGTLYEQHNPDYIPEENGGPAVVVADSENNRVVEYQRVNGSWQQSWIWQDERMDWPRDVDRLPNGHTLITDTHENRVFEVDRNGEIVWSIRVPNGYEAERLGTGDESTGGPSAVKADLTNVTTGGNGPTSVEHANEGERTQLSKLWHGIQFVIPSWMNLLDLIVALEAGAVLLVWGGIELHWQGFRVHWPVSYTQGERQ